MTESIVEYLRDLAATIGGIETSHCLAERRSISSDEPTEMPYLYTEGGGYVPVEVDSGSVSYFRLVNPISFDEVEGRTPVKALKGSYPFTFVAMVRRDDNNPLTYSQDVANLFEGRNKDLASILKASSVHITVSSIETDTTKIWKQEFQVPATTPNYTRSMVMIELTVEVVANRDCWVNCADYPDILQGFPWCAKPAATLARLTDSQLDCLRDELCGVIPDGSATNSDSTFTISVPSGVDVPLPNITKTDSDGTTSSIPSNQDVTCTLAADGSASNSDGSYTVAVPSGVGVTIPDTPISANGDLVISQPSTIAKDVVVRYVNGTLVGSVVGSEIEIPNPVVVPTLTIDVFSDIALTIPVVAGNLGQTVYIKTTATGITPTSYTFSFDGSNDLVVTQAGDVYTWVINSVGAVDITARATDGTGATANATGFSFTSILNIVNSCKFDGVNDLTTSWFLPLLGESFSVSMWVKMNSLSLSVPFFSVGTAFGGRPSLAVGWRQATGTLGAFAWNQEWSNVASGVITADLLWHNMICTYNESTQTVMVYWDGATIVNTGSFGLVFDLSVFILGYAHDWPSVGQRRAPVNITDAAVHNTVLSAAQVAAMQTFGVLSGNEVQRYPMIEPVGTTIGYIEDIVGGIPMELLNMTAGFGVVADVP